MTHTYSVRKRQRGLHGQWFRYRGRGYATEDTAFDAAKALAASQCAAGVQGTEIDVVNKGKIIVTFRWKDDQVTTTDWRM
jgi:hypothetical protein